MEDVGKAIKQLQHGLDKLPALSDKYLKYSDSVVMFDELESELKLATDALQGMFHRLDFARLIGCELMVRLKELTERVVKQLNCIEEGNFERIKVTHAPKWQKVFRRRKLREEALCNCLYDIRANVSLLAECIVQLRGYERRIEQTATTSSLFTSFFGAAVLTVGAAVGVVHNVLKGESVIDALSALAQKITNYRPATEERPKPETECEPPVNLGRRSTSNAYPTHGVGQREKFHSNTSSREHKFEQEREHASMPNEEIRRRSSSNAYPTHGVGQRENVHSNAPSREHKFEQARERASMRNEEIRRQKREEEMRRAEKEASSNKVEIEIEKWKSDNTDLRSLLSSLHTILPESIEWKSVSFQQLHDVKAVRKCYRIALLRIHPDKVASKNLDPQSEMLAQRIFQVLHDAFEKFTQMS